MNLCGVICGRSLIRLDRYIFLSKLSGFHEAFASATILSVNNPTHFQRLALTTGNSSFAHETNLNFLMQMALKKVAYAPFAYLVDQVNEKPNRPRI